MPSKTHAVLTADGVLVKRGKQVVKFWKHNGYAINEQDLQRCRLIRLETAYDGTLEATPDTVRAKGIANNFKGEQQYVLPVADWKKVNAQV